MDAWFNLTAMIKQNAWRRDGDDTDEHIAKLLRNRHALLERLPGKFVALKNLLNDQVTGSLKHTLIYTIDKCSTLLRSLNRLSNKRASRSASQPPKRLTIVRQRNLSSSHFKTEMLMSSQLSGYLTRVWTYRRFDQPSFSQVPQVSDNGLRGEAVYLVPVVLFAKHSAIRDFLVLPRSFDTKLDIDARFIVRSEIRGALEFSRLARKTGSPVGPLGSIDRMVKAAYL